MDKKDLLNSYEFEVGIGPLITLSFSRITGLSNTGEIGVIGEGGNNDAMYMYLKPKREPDTTVFERGWMTGTVSTVMSYLFTGLIVNNVTIIVKRNGKKQKTLTIDKGIISKIEFSDLDAKESKILIKSMEIKHNGVKEQKGSTWI